MKNIVYLAAFLMLPGLSFARGTQSPADTIPFRYKNNMIIVQVEIKGKSRNFFFDTGAPTLISKELKEELNLAAVASKSITDANLKNTEVKAVRLPSLTIGNIKVDDMPVTVIDIHKTIPQLSCLSIEGFLGLDVFKRKVVQIDLQNKRLVVSGNPSLLKTDERFANKMILLKAQNAVLVEVKFGDVFVENALFDTGMTGGLYSIADQTYQYVNKATPLDRYIVARGYGAVSKVASGTEAESEKMRLKFEEMNIGLANIKNPVTNTGNHPYSLLGAQVLKYGTVTLDFINERFYFEPAVGTNEVLPAKTAGFELKVEKNEFLVGIVWQNSVAEKEGLKAGYKIIEYGSKKVEKLSQAEVCNLLYSDPKEGQVQKKELKLKFIDDKGNIRALVLPMVDILQNAMPMNNQKKNAH